MFRKRNTSVVCTVCAKDRFVKILQHTLQNYMFKTLFDISSGEEIDNYHENCKDPKILVQFMTYIMRDLPGLLSHKYRTSTQSYT